LEVLKPIIYRTDYLKEVTCSTGYRIFTDVLSVNQAKRLVRRYRSTTHLIDAW